jgi:hypothetical protein
VEENMRALRERRILWVVSVLIAVACVSVPARAKYGGGSGTADDPYQIWTAGQMNALGAEPNDWDKHFQLMADLDLSAYDGQEGRPAFNLIAPDADPAKSGFQGVPFSGVFDGNGHTILGFTHSSEKRQYVGLFGHVAGPAGEIRSLGLINVTLKTGKGWMIGGLVGHNEGTVAGCHASGLVSGEEDVGGLVGDNAGVIIRCHYWGQVKGDMYIGGLVGRSGTSAARVTCCYSTGTVSGRFDAVGGLVGENSGDVTHCYSTSNVYGDWATGGLVGWNEAVIMYCYSRGAVSGDGAYIGGLVGDNQGGVVTCCYSTGAVSGLQACTGGLVGLFGGGRTGGGIVSHGLWDVEASGQSKSDGGTGRTTSQMHDIRTYLNARWDFVGETGNGTCEVWQMLPGDDCPSLTAFTGYVPLSLPGAGTPEDPYLISNAGELGAMVHYGQDAHYQLTASINLRAICWATPVVPRFGGTFDGNGMTLSHLTVVSGRYVGLFGRLEPGAEVKDLQIVDVNIVGSEDYVGTLAGDSAGTVSRCHSAGRVDSGGEYVGGLVGRSRGEVTDCHSEEAITGTGWGVGGLAGENDGGRVTRCSFNGTVDWYGPIGQKGPVAGLVGWNRDGTITQCYSKGTVTGEMEVGGLVGNNSGNVTQSYSTAGVSSRDEVGGLAGLNFGTLTDCYSTGVVSGYGQYVGGLVGCGEGQVRSQAGPPDVVVGEVNDCFWDILTSGQNISAGGTGKTTRELQRAATFLAAGWDFAGETANGAEDVWWIEAGKGYPRLWWEGARE